MIPSLAIPIAYKLLLAGSQFVKSKTLEKENTRPDFKIPESAVQALNQSRFIASRNRLPGQDRAEELMQKNMANAAYSMSQATDNPNQITENIARMSERNNDTINQMTIQGANAKRMAERDLNSELDQMSKFELDKYNWENIQPYQDAMSKSAQLKEAAAQNSYDALKTGVELYSLGGGLKDSNGGQMDAIASDDSAVDIADDGLGGYSTGLKKKRSKNPIVEDIGLEEELKGFGGFIK